MFGFKKKSGGQNPSAAIWKALVADGLPAGMDAESNLGIVDSRDNYAGRKVTYFRVFDRALATSQGIDVRAYSDLDAHKALILRAGHVEQDGTVIITWRERDVNLPNPVRENADRSQHPDDEKFVFPGGRS